MRGKGLLALPLILAGCGTTGIVAHEAIQSPVSGGCSVTLTQTWPTAQAFPSAECVGSYTFRSWSLVAPGNNKGETLFDTVTGPPWVVNLPECQWQIDFAVAGPKPQHILAGAFGHRDCSTTTTTEAETTTTGSTIAPSTTTTTTPSIPTTTTNVVPPPPPIPTTTTLPVESETSPTFATAPTAATTPQTIGSTG